MKSEVKSYLVWAYYDKVLFITNMFRRVLYIKDLNNDETYQKFDGNMTLQGQQGLAIIGKMSKEDLMLELL